MNEFSDLILTASQTVFNQTAKTTSLFVLPIVLIRFSFLNSTGGSSNEYGSTIKGLILYFCLIAGFGQILDVILKIPEHFGPGISFGTLNKGIENNSNSPVSTSLIMLPNTLTWVIESLIAILYNAASALYFALTIIMSAIAPVVFLTGCLLGIGLGVSVFFGLLFMVASFPIIFSACDALHSVMPQSSVGGLSGLVFELLITFFKLAGPLALSIASLSSAPGKAMMGTLSMGMSSLGSAAHHGSGFKAGCQGKSFEPSHPRSLSEISRTSAQSLSHSAGKGLRRLSQGKVTKPSGNPSKTSSSQSSRIKGRHNSGTSKLGGELRTSQSVSARGNGSREHTSGTHNSSVIKTKGDAPKGFANSQSESPKVSESRGSSRSETRFQSQSSSQSRSVHEQSQRSLDPQSKPDSKRSFDLKPRELPKDESI